MKQKGFTLVELLIALPIGVVILGAIVSGVFLIPRGTAEVRDQAAALTDLENTAHWLNRDIVMGQVTDLLPGLPPVSTVTMDWNDYTGGPNSSIAHYVYYYLSGTQLLREYDSADNITIAGRNLSYAGFSIDNEGLVTVTLNSTPAGVRQKTVTRSYEIQMRALQ
ncbi:MAG: prepilin-type N-terminal cleavage/methylation domain-containing protein [Dehalococcoidales bacterium]|nr:prepilin-type N-terminal cleavage/methylation domain-containing protein [Dehalococcoidales bacterium]